MALTDYKITHQHIKNKTIGAIRIYEGDITTEDELNINDEPVPVTRYRRTRLLREVEFDFQELNKTRVLQWLNSILAEDKTRTPIDKQRMV